MVNQRKIKQSIRHFSTTIFKTAKQLRSIFVASVRNYIPKQFFNPKSLRVGVAGLLLAVLLLEIFIPNAQNIALAGTATFVQSNWNGGVSSTAVASDPSNRTGWNYFTTSTNLDFTSTTAPRLNSSTYYFTDDTTITTNGSSTGGLFAAGTFSNTVTNTGAINLSVADQISVNAFDTVLPAIPAAMGGFRRNIIVTGTYVYVLQATSTGGNANVRRYNTVGNVWESFPVAPGSVSTGADIAVNSSSVFLLRGNTTQSLYKHTLSDTSSAWSTFLSIPSACTDGSAVLVDDTYVYVFQATTPNFYRHTLADTSSAWVTFTNTGLSVTGADTRVVMDANYVYVLGSNSLFWRHTLTTSTGAWETYINVTGNNSTGSALLVDGSYVYVLAASAGASRVYRRTPSNTSSAWTAYADPPSLVMGDGAGIANDGTYLYIMSGGSATTVYRHSANTTTGAWDTLTASPIAISTGSGIGTDGSNLYIVPGGGLGASQFIRHTLADTSSAWTGSHVPSFTAIPGATGSGADLAVDANYIYALQGNSGTGYYRHSRFNTSSAWDSFTALPTAVNSTGGSTVVDANYAYVLQSTGGNVYRHSISVTSGAWTSFGSVGTAGLGGEIYVDANYAYVILGGNATTTYRHTLATSTGAWEAYATFTPSGAVANTTGEAFMFDSNYAYAYLGNNTTTFFRHALSNTSSAWDSYALLPGGGGAGTYLAVDSNYVYFLRGSSFNVYRHTLSDTSSAWESFTPFTGTAFVSNSRLVVDGTYIYALNPLTNNFLYRHVITDTSSSWISTVLPITFGSNGAAMVPDGSGAMVYTLTGSSGSTDLLRFINTQRTYQSSGTFTSAAIALNSAALLNVSWNSSTPSVTGPNALQFQIATSTDNNTYSSFVGSDGTTASFFTASTTLTGALTTGAAYFKYKAYLATSNTAYTPSFTDFTVTYVSYAATGTLVSSIYNSGDVANRISNLQWTGSTSSLNILKFQIRASSTLAGVSTSVWSGPDGTVNTYYTTSSANTIATNLGDGAGDQYYQYQAFFTSNGVGTPVLTSATVTYVVNLAPEIQNVVASQNSDGTVSVSYEIRSSDTLSDTGSEGVLTPSFKYCAGGTSCQTITALLSGATSTKAVNSDGVTWTSVTTTWTPTTDFNDIWDAQAKLQITVNDLQAANNLAIATSSAFTLDTKAPINPSILVSASSTLAVITVTAVDTSTPVVMRLATSTNALNAASYSAFATTTELALGVDPATVYVQFKDAYSNSTTPISVTTPASPTYPIIQDTSNVTPPLQYDYLLFMAWKTVALPPQGTFGAYKIYRSTDQTNWSLITSITDRTTNYYIDATIASNTLYYYKVASTDSLGNVSYSSAVVNGFADGIQDYGEGGGGTAPPPVLTNIATSTVSPSSFTVTWDSDTLSNSKVSYSASAGVFTSNVTVASYVNSLAELGQHQVIVAGLTPNTTYYFKVTSVDASGNTTNDDNGGNGYVVRTSPGPTITALPSISNISNTAADVTWETSLDANSYVVFSTSSEFTATTTVADAGTFATNHSLTMTGLTANTRYFYYIYSTDQSNYTVYDKNIVSGVAQYYSFITSNDSSAPTFSGFDATVNLTSAAITWLTSEASDSQVEYGTTLAYGSTTTINDTLTVLHYALLSGLATNTLYYYRVHSTDANGNAGVSSGQTFITSQVTYDPPTISNVTTSSVALAQATINWDTDRQTNGTVEYGTTNAYGSIAGNLYDFSTSSHHITLIGLTGNTMYYFRVNSTDQSGNNATSSQYTFLTAADVTPPVISSLTEIVDQTSALVTWTTDELAMAQVDYGVASDTLDITVAVTSTFSTSHALVLAGLAPNTTYYFQVTSADTSANTTTQTGLSFTTVAFGEVTRTISGGGSTSAPAAQSTEAPKVTNVKTVNQDPFTVLVTWDTDKESNTLVKYGYTNSYGVLVGDETARTLSHSITLSSLDPATTYHFKAESFVDTSLVGLSADLTFTTLNTAGEIVTSTPETTPTSTDSTTSADDMILTKIKTASVRLLEKMLRSFSINPAIKEIPEDSIVATIADITQRVVGAPTIVGLRPEVQVHGTEAIIGWYTDKKTDGIVSYVKHSEYQPAEARPYTSSAADTSPISTVHVVDLKNLEPATQYHFQVISKGEIGSETKSKDFVFTTESVLPTIEDITIVEVRANAADLAWKTNIPTISTIVYTNLTTKKTATVGDQAMLVNHTFTVPDLDPGAKYSVVIKSENEAKDITASAPISFTTIIDDGAPLISNLAANSTLYPGKNSKVQTIMTWHTDEPASSQIFYQEGVQDKGSVLSTPFDANLTTDHILVLTNFKPGTVYKYWSESADSSGNTSHSATFTMLTPIQKETIIDIIGKNFQSVFGWTNRVKL